MSTVSFTAGTGLRVVAAILLMAIRVKKNRFLKISKATMFVTNNKVAKEKWILMRADEMES